MVESVFHLLGRWDILGPVSAALLAATPLAAWGDPAGTGGDAPKPRLALVYAKGYEIRLGGLEKLHAFDIHKYSKIHDRLVEDGLAGKRDFRVPKPLDEAQIRLVHSPAFLRSLKDPATVAAYLEAPVVRFLPAAVVEKSILRPFRLASGGTVLASRLALEHGLAVNLGGGYHHAKPDKGEGFCIYADMPIAIRILQGEGLIRRALVVDLDVHQGNGTIVCLPGDEAVFTFSMHESNIYPIPKERGDLDVELAPGTGDEPYLKLLQKHLPDAIRRSRPDLVFFQAGCDPLKGDPLASLAMTTDGIVRRDAYVIDTCVRQRIPVVMLLGGGYSENAWSTQHASIRRTLKTYGVAQPAQGGGGPAKPAKFFGKRQ